jgi:NADPH:quinone reductase-like Zn-dependent oxidoreductase
MESGIFVLMVGIIYALDQNRFGPGAVLECDFVGTVEEMGDQVDRDDLTMGDTIAGLVRGGESILFSLIAIPISMFTGLSNSQELSRTWVLSPNTVSHRRMPASSCHQEWIPQRRQPYH